MFKKTADLVAVGTPYVRPFWGFPTPLPLSPAFVSIWPMHCLYFLKHLKRYQAPFPPQPPLPSDDGEQTMPQGGPECSMQLLSQSLNIFQFQFADFVHFWQLAEQKMMPLPRI